MHVYINSSDMICIIKLSHAIENINQIRKVNDKQSVNWFSVQNYINNMACMWYE